MGTHPIFESDFDCLTERLKQISNGAWSAKNSSANEKRRETGKIEKRQRHRHEKIGRSGVDDCVLRVPLPNWRPKNVSAAFRGETSKIADTGRSDGADRCGQVLKLMTK